MKCVKKQALMNKWLRPREVSEKIPPQMTSSEINKNDLLLLMAHFHLFIGILGIGFDFEKELIN